MFFLFIFSSFSVLEPFDNIIKATIDYTKQRNIFGAPIINNQTVHFTLAELQTEVEMLRALFYKSISKNLSFFFHIAFFFL